MCLAHTVKIIVTKGLIMDNQIIMQFFEWNIDNDGNHWNRLKAAITELEIIGITGIWIPPCTKATEQNNVGYAAYDLYDLGEIYQKGTIRTKYGSKLQLIDAIEEAHRHGIRIFADAVLNHKAGADATERFLAIEVEESNRMHELSEPHEIEGWTKFYFPGRGDTYSGFKWNYTHFSATDRDELTKRNALFKIYGEGKVWAKGVDKEKNNYDYLMFADVDYSNEFVVEEVKRWASWIIDTLHLDGFRLDAIKHIDQTFIKLLIDHVRAHTSENFFVVGEYWLDDADKLNAFINTSNQEIQLFDVALHYNFYQASRGGRDFDLTHLFDGTLVATNKFRAVTFVDNHDSQPGQALESWVDDWFKPIAYALILLRVDGLPCLFYGDYYGINGGPAPKKGQLDPLLYARRHLAYGEEVDYFNHSNVIGFLRKGDLEHTDSGIAVVISNGEEGTKLMSFGPEHAGRAFFDLTGGRNEEITLNASGSATFTVNGGNVSVWASIKQRVSAQRFLSSLDRENNMQ